MTIRIPAYAALVALVALAARWLDWDGTQVLATSVFAGFIFGTLLSWKFRLAFALAGITALLAAGVLDIPHLIEFAILDVILVLVSMMIIIGFLEERRFSRWWWRKPWVTWITAQSCSWVPSWSWPPCQRPWWTRSPPSSS